LSSQLGKSSIIRLKNTTAGLLCRGQWRQYSEHVCAYGDLNRVEVFPESELFSMVKCQASKSILLSQKNKQKKHPKEVNK
jgi:hypothetical protein